MAGSDFLDRIAKLSQKQLALLALELQQKLERQPQGSGAAVPIAVVGMACRMPGEAVTPEAYWELLSRGRDAISETPPDRWDVDAYYDPDPDALGKIATRWGGFLTQIDQFDPDFFGIAPREAINMDPQQRLVLEVAWEALERAGHAPDSLEKSRTGVFLGICNSDYFQLNAGGDPRRIDAYLASGSASSIASGRVSYVLGLQGPSVSVDTACSSSLVAVHLACQSLRAGESKLALAGGVNLILRPETSMALSRAHMMASDGRCKAFDSRADGFVRAEGCGLVVLKRLADAQADGDEILAVIRASTSNQDGRSSGITAPNGPSQEAVIRDALAMAGLKPADIDYVEAHGTGTALGDPIEIQALAAALGPGRDAQDPLLVGSAKTNVGHLESAAGIAGLLKVILALQHRLIPPHLHLRERNPHIDWRSMPIEVPTQLTPWRSRGVRRAGVSSFGFSGTNAHLILEEAPRAAAPAPSTVKGHLLPLSARSDAALTQFAQRVAQFLAAHPEEDLDAVCAALGTGRAHFEHRLAIVADDRAALTDALLSVANGSKNAASMRGAAGESADVAFLFSGQGSQYAGMGRELYDAEPVFRRVIDECEQALSGLTDRPLRQILFESDRTELVQTANLQPALFAVEVALAALWRSWGIVPSAVLGHSLGEFSAACVAGVFSVTDGIRLVAARGRLMQSVRGAGRMVAVNADAAIVRRALDMYGAGRATIAAVNAADQIVISGYADAVEAVTRELSSGGATVRALDVSHAFHSPQMDEMSAAFTQQVREISYKAPQISLVSNVTGGLWGEDRLTADPATYWTRHVREAVQFQRGMQTLEKLGTRVYVEIGPNPILLGMGRACVANEALEWLPSLRAGQPEREQLLRSLGALYVNGASVNWRAVSGTARRPQHALPTYPFQRRRFWMSTQPSGGPARARVTSAAGGELAGERLDTAAPVFETTLDLDRFPYLDQHRVGERAVAPGALLLEMLRDAGRRSFEQSDVVIEDVGFHEMLALPEEGSRRVQVVLTEASAAGAAATIYSRDEQQWTRHATARISMLSRAAGNAPITLDAVRKECQRVLAPDDFYAQLTRRSLQFGPAFRGIVELKTDGRAVLGRVRLSETLSASKSEQLHPALLDAALQLLGVAVTQSGLNETYMQVSLERMLFLRPAGTELWGYATLRPGGGTEPTGDIQLFSAQGDWIGALTGIGLRRVPAGLLAGAKPSAHPDWLYDVVWRHDPRGEVGWTLPALRSLADPLRATLAPLSAQHGLDAFTALSPQMERASALFVARALEKMQCELRPNARVSTATLRRDGHVSPSFERLFERMLSILAEERVLRPHGADAWEVIAPLPAGEGSAECERLLSAHPAYRAELALLARCGERLAQVVQGTQDPLQLLFPEGDPAALEGLYRDSPSARVFNQLVQDALAKLVQHHSGARPLRILEIGAGTGSTTHYVLPVLPPRTEYVFTDISPLFVARAAERFGQRAGMEFRVFDVDDKSPAEQGLTPGSFDIVVAANVLHATRDLRRTVGRVRELLRPGGALILLEGTRPLRWVDLTFGMTEGWWRFSDRELRPQHALLTPAQWGSLLTACGFDDVAAVPETVEAAAQSVVLARAGAPADAVAAVTARPQWLLCSRDLRSARDAAAACKAAGIDTLVVDKSDVDRLTASLRERSFTPTAVLVLAAEASGEDPVRSASDDSVLATALLRAMSAFPASSRLWVITRGAHAVHGRLASFEQAALWGWGRVAALEHPERCGGMIDLDPAAAGIDVTRLRAAITTAVVEDQIAIRGGQRYVPRLVRSSAGAAGAQFTWRDDRAYAVTGWMGGLGLLLVQWLATRGVRHLVLIGRRDPAADVHGSAEANRVLAEIRAQGVTASIVVADVANATSLRPVFDRFGRDLPALAGVFHVAAHLDSRAIEALDAAAMDSMLNPKARGAWNLHQLTADRELDCFVLFSSTTSLWGAQGLAHYAAANQVLDALAHMRQASGLPALSVNWGTWDTMRLTSEQDRELYATAGLQRMPADGAFAMLEAVLAAGCTQTAVAAVDWDLLKPIYETRRARPFFSEVANVATRRGKPAVTGESRVAETWQFDDVPVNARAEALAERVRGEIASVLGLGDPAELDSSRGLFEMGMDSLMAVELRSRLQKRAGRSLPSTLTFNYPNATALTQFLEQVLFALPPAGTAPVISTQTEAATQSVVAAIEREEMSEDQLEQLLAEKLRSL